MESMIRTARTFDVNHVAFGNVKTLDNGGRMIYMSYNGGPLIVQTPEMFAPFGLNRWTNDAAAAGGADGAPVKYSIELAFKGLATRASEKRFFEVMSGFDRKVVETALENSAAWLKKKHNSIEVLEALYTPCIKLPKDKETSEVTDKYPPSIRLSLPFRDGAFKCDAYSVDGAPMDLVALEKDGGSKGARITALMQCSGVWIAGGKFGCTWKVLQLRVLRSESLKSFAFIGGEDDDDCDEDGGCALLPPAHSGAAAAAPKKDYVDVPDSEDDDVDIVDDL